MTSQLTVHARRLGATVVMILALGPALIVTAAPAQAYVPSARTVATYEARVIYEVNRQRTRYGRVKLYSSSCPDRYAERWAAYLARTWRFYHQGLRPILGACRATVVAENLARGGVGADRIVALWMASPGHRANILDRRLTRIGVAAVYKRGQWVVAADFTRA